MRIITASAVAFFALTAFAYAGDDPFAVYYSNTLVFTTAKGVVTKVWANKDRTWTSTSTDPKNPKASGDWVSIGNWTCVTDAAMPKQKPNCFETVVRKVGDKWSTTEEDKSVTQSTIVAGR
jgi:hypothetical protein